MPLQGVHRADVSLVLLVMCSYTASSFTSIGTSLGSRTVSNMSTVEQVLVVPMLGVGQIALADLDVQVCCDLMVIAGLAAYVPAVRAGEIVTAVVAAPVGTTPAVVSAMAT